MTEYVSRPLPFYNRVELVRLRSARWHGKPNAIFLLDMGDKTYWLNGTSPPIHEVNSKAPVRITRRNVLEYIRFFCFFVRGEEGQFYLVEDIGDSNLAALKAVEPELLEGLAAPARILSIDSGIITCSAVVYYSNALFQATFAISPSGMCEMKNDTPIAGGVPGQLDMSIR